MKILILNSSSRNFPIDFHEMLKTAGLESHCIPALNEFISSPLRAEPFLGILEVGTIDDIERALLAFEWADSVQPLAPARFLLLIGSKHISLGDKAGRFRGVEIAQLPLPPKNLLFKTELQLKLLAGLVGRSAKTPEGFLPELRDRERVMVLKGPGPKDGAWNSVDAPQGKVRWRWVSLELQPGKSDLKWTLDSPSAPVYDEKESAWFVKGEGLSLTCEKDGKAIFSLEPGKTKSSEKTVIKPGETKAPDTNQKVGEHPPLLPTEFAIRKEEKTGLSGKNEPISPAFQPSGPSWNLKNDADEKTPVSIRIQKDITLEYETKQKTGELPGNDRDRPTQISSQKSPAPGGGTGSRLDTAAVPDPGREKGSSSAAPAGESKSRDQAGTADSPGQGKFRQKITPNDAPVSSFAGSMPPADNGPVESFSGKNPLDAPEAKRTDIEKEAKAPSGMRDLTGIDRSREIHAREPAQRPQEGAKVIPATAKADHGKGQQAYQNETPPGKAELTAKPEARTEESLAKNKEIISDAGAAEKSKKAKFAGEAEREGRNSIEIPEEANSRQDQGKVIEKNTGPIVISTSTQQNEDAPEEDNRWGKEKLIIPKITLPPVGAANPEQEPKRVITGAAGEPPGAEHFLKMRHFEIMTLEELGDQDSTWHPVEGYRIYLGAKHRYYGLKQLEDIFPLWVYQGELAPEFLDRQQAWKFYDRKPQIFGRLEDLPGLLAVQVRMLAKDGGGGAGNLPSKESSEPTPEAAAPGSVSVKVEIKNEEPVKKESLLKRMVKKVFGAD